MALYHSKGRISEMSEITSGIGRNGNKWARMALVIEIPGFYGTFYKQVFQVGTEQIDAVQAFDIGDWVEVSFSIYAMEWNGRWYNNVDLVKITSQEEQQEEEDDPAPKAPARQKPEPVEQEKKDDDLPF